jgi:hypothetical protein
MARIRVFSRVLGLPFLVFALVFSAIPVPIPAAQPESVRIGTIVNVTGRTGFIGTGTANIPSKKWVFSIGSDVSIVSRECFEPSGTNMVPQLARAKSANPEYSDLLYDRRSMGCNCQKLQAAWDDYSGSREQFPEECVRVDEKMMQGKYDPAKQVTLFYGFFRNGIQGVAEVMRIAPTTDRVSTRRSLARFYRYICTDTEESPGPQVDLMRPMVFKNGELLPYAKNGKLGGRLTGT